MKRPSPCATHTPKVEDASGASIREGESAETSTLRKADSKRRLTFSAMVTVTPPVLKMPISTMSWQPLQTPNDSVSGRA